MISIIHIFKKAASATSATVLILSQTLAYSAGFFISSPSIVGALDTGYSVPTTAVSIGTNWDVTTPSNLHNSDDVYVSESGGSEHGFSGFNFSIPDDATITGIEVFSEAKSSEELGCQLGLSVSLDGGASFGSTSVFDLGNTDGSYTHGGVANTVGLSPVAADFASNSNFLVGVQDRDPGSNCNNEATTYIDQMLARVYYTEAQVETKYDICHASNSATNPYQSISVNESAVDGIGNSDHYGVHTGPVATTLEVAQQLKDDQIDWGDIIPPVAGIHAGLNWTVEGQAILQNDCVVPEGFEPPENVSLRLTKTVINDDGGTLDADDFGIDIEGFSTHVFGNPASTDGDTYVYSSASSFAPLDHPIVISENDTEGYDEGEWSCDNGVTGENLTVTVTLDAGDDVICSITNNDTPQVVVAPATVSVSKFVKNNDGGIATADDFPVYLNGDLLSGGASVDISDTVNARSFDSVEVAAGAPIVITEDQQTGYELLSITCFVGEQFLESPYVAPEGAVVNCNVQNDDLAPETTEVTINKEVENNWGGTLGADNFTLFIEQLGGQVVGTANGSIQILLAAGQYQIGEQQEAGYVLSGFSGNCDQNGLLTVVIGSENTCTIENEDIPARIRVHKSVTNNNGGALAAEDFSFEINGNNQSVPFAVEGQYVEVAVSAGSHTVEETGDLEGYKANYDGCENIQAEIGQTYNCYVTNDDIAPVVYVTKYSDPCFSDQLFDFRIDGIQSREFVLSGGCHYSEGLVLAELVTDSVIGNTYQTDDFLKAGEFSISEMEVDGWYQEYANCYEMTDIFAFEGYPVGLGTSFTTEIGGRYQCEFENHEESSVTVTKFHDYNENGEWDDGEPTLPGWDIVLSEGCLFKQEMKMQISEWDEDEEEEECDTETSTQPTEEDGTTTFEELNRGIYSVDEVLQDGWTQSALYCDRYFDEWPTVTQSLLLDREDGPKKEMNSFLLRAGSEQDCYVGNYRNPEVTIVKTNNTTGSIRRNTEVTFTLTVTVPEPDESGVLRGNNDGPEYLPVTVTDNLTDEFDYIAGSFTATSSVRGDLKDAGITTDPSYASPGLWTLTNLASNEVLQNEIITLTYRALVGPTVNAGSYPTIASVIGYGDVVDITATDSDEDKVVVIVPAVLGASTTSTPVATKAVATLASTGQNSLYNLFVAMVLMSLAIAIAPKRLVVAKSS